MKLVDLPASLGERTRPCNQRPIAPDGAFVLYWMHHAARAEENPALDVAVCVANALGVPVLVYQGLGGRHRFNNDRHHTFIMEGAADVQEQLRQRGIAYAFDLPRDGAAAGSLSKLIEQARLVVTDDFPAPPFPQWVDRLAQQSAAAFWAVDTACIVPMLTIGKAHTRAFQFRKQALPDFEKRVMQPWQDVTPEAAAYSGALPFESIDFSRANIAALCAACAIDHSVGPVHHTRGGSAAGYARWEAFERHGLGGYARLRNDAAVAPPEGVSQLSPYLHHGHVSPFRLAREAALRGGGGAEKFLDELFVWRELAHNFCFHHRDPESFGALPGWAVETLEAHANDSRDVVYTWEQLARGATKDELWNAAQASLVRHGMLHNNLRMTWGKAFLRWTRSPQEALRLMIDLNHRYALDGNDPNSYGGLLWCLGQFDRPFPPEQPVLGTVRTRDTAAHAARLDVDAYQERIAGPSTRKRRVAVVGAGPAGLNAARILSDHGHEVVVFDKGRGVGGRTSRRRRAPFVFDHGAQYFTARDEDFRRFVGSWQEAGVVARWRGDFAAVVSDRVEMQEDAVRYVGTPGMNALAKHLAADLDVRTGVRIERMERDDESWNLYDEAGARGSFDWLVVALPAQQAARLLEGTSALGERVRECEMLPCWAVMLGFDQRITAPFDAAHVAERSLAWVARNNSKPNRGNAEAWVLQASPEWSQAHVDDTKEEVIEALMTDFGGLPGVAFDAPVHRDAQRWLFGVAREPLGAGALFDAPNGLVVCGDWCATARIEGAWLSGAAAAGRLLGLA